MGATVLTWLPSSGGIAQSLPNTLLGRRIFFTEKVPKLGTTGDIGIYDLSYYGIGDRADFRVDTSNAPRFTTDQTSWRFVERVDG